MMSPDERIYLTCWLITYGMDYIAPWDDGPLEQLYHGLRINVSSLCERGYVTEEHNVRYTLIDKSIKELQDEQLRS